MTRERLLHAAARFATPAFVVAALAVVFGGLHVVRRVVLSFTNPRAAHEALEGAAFLSMSAWTDGGWPAMYPTSFSEPGGPFVITPYPPLFHLLWRGVALLMGDHATYAPGRAVAIVGLGAIVAQIYACARRAGGTRLTSSVFAGAFVLPVPVALWAGVARVDVPGIALSLAGLWLYLRYREHAGPGICGAPSRSSSGGSPSSRSSPRRPRSSSPSWPPNGTAVQRYSRVSRWVRFSSGIWASTGSRTAGSSTPR